MSSIPLGVEAVSRTALIARACAAGIHLAASAAAAALAATLVFALWYPPPFGEISGGRDLFLLLMTVDVIIGPLLTLLVFDHRKPKDELRRDLTVVVLLQVAALGYGMYTVATARPAIIALEGDRLRVVRAVDLAAADLGSAPDGLKSLSWSGPVRVATRAPTEDEKLDTIERGLAGEDIGMRPRFWRATTETNTAYATAAKPLTELTRLHPENGAVLSRAIEAARRSAAGLGYLPVLARGTDWSALIDLKNGDIVGYVPIDGF
jgi:hypothetical protein